MITAIDMIDGKTGEVIYTRFMKAREPSEKQIKTSKEGMIQDHLFGYVLRNLMTAEEVEEYRANPPLMRRKWMKEGRKRIEWRVYEKEEPRRGLTKSECLSELKHARAIACQASMMVGGEDFGRGQISALNFAIELVSAM